MNINFKTHFPWPGADGLPEPTLFVGKIDRGFWLKDPTKPLDLARKIHTIRRIGRRPRFREGMKLTFSTGSRFKPERFAETTCRGVQVLSMRAETTAKGIDFKVWVVIPGTIPWLLDSSQLVRLAENDGLSVEQFVRWFTLDLIAAGGAAQYEVVHWTDLLYG